MNNGQPDTPPHDQHTDDPAAWGLRSVLPDHAQEKPSSDSMRDDLVEPLSLIIHVTDDIQNEPTESSELPTEQIDSRRLLREMPEESARAARIEAVPGEKNLEEDALASFARSMGGVELRLIELTRAIRQHPEAPASYVIRGEILLASGAHDAAARDFEQAVKLARTAAQNADWGYIYQGLIDRARQGLRRC